MKQILFLLIASTSFIQADKEFEIYNKASRPIWFILKNGSRGGEFDPTTAKTTPFKIVEVKSGEQRIRDLDPNRVTKLEIFDRDPRAMSLASSQSVTGGKEYTFTLGKDIYVTWDEQGLRPQTGPIRGWAGRTKSGLSLKNNVTRNDIRFEMTKPIPSGPLPKVGFFGRK